MLLKELNNQFEQKELLPQVLCLENTVMSLMLPFFLPDPELDALIISQVPFIPVG